MPAVAAPTSASCVSCGMSRRSFVSAATLAAVAVVLDACASSSAGGFTGPTGGAFTVKLSDFPALATVGGIARVESSGAPTALVRTGTSSFSAFSMICPHQGSTINITSGSFTCPNHGAQFTSSGTWKGGERTGNLTSYAATFDAAAGTIAIGRP